MVMKRIVTGAGYGSFDWLVQRITAVVMAVFTVVLIAQVFCRPHIDYAAWHNIFAFGLMRFLSFLFLVSLFYHAWVGVRDIFMDYIKSDGLRLTLHTLVVLVLVGYGGWAAQILWRL